jgi:hypothetical protein
MRLGTLTPEPENLAGGPKHGYDIAICIQQVSGELYGEWIH